MSRNRKQKRIIAIIICAVFIAALVLSLAYLAKEASHECIGHNCPICAQMQLVQKTVDHLGSALTYLFIAGFSLVFLFQSLLRIFTFIPLNTPVAQNVRMNN